ncbi:MAG: aminotransferase class IV [Candidatus Omnitrophica bacterium]|nr:aminotransferase class IV [Candidatus Omnitrophota bacterium]MBL7210386.1 aminotransferase class IV [Candidatus Omnitrophota bacterium]
MREAKVSVLEPGFLYGAGLFETMRSCNNKIVYLDAHLQRIKDSSRLINLGFPFTLSGLKRIIQEAVRINGFADSYVRLTLWEAGKGASASVIVKKYRPYPAAKYCVGFRGCIGPYRQGIDSGFPRVKSTSYLFYRLSLKDARRRGFDEAVILNSLGFIVEGSRTNIFFVKDGELFTPALECGGLAGITRSAVFGLCASSHIKVYEGKFSPADLYAADEAFLTNSLMGIMPLASFEAKPIGKNKCRRLTSILIKKYNCLLK